jgi:hypothetical protein
VGHLVMGVEERRVGRRDSVDRGGGRNRGQVMLVVVEVATMVQKGRAPFEIVLLVHQRLSVGGSSRGGVITQALHSYNSLR